MNRKLLLVVVAGVTLSTLLCGSASAGEDKEVANSEGSPWPGHLSYEIGYKLLYLGEGDPSGLIGAGAASQFEFAGIDFDIRKAEWPINLAVQTLFAGGSGKFSVEANMGLRKIFECSPQFEPFIGAGFSAVSINDVFEGSGTGYGGYAEAGLYWNFSKHFHAGFRAAYTYAPVDFSAIDIFTGVEEDRHLNGGGFHALLM